MRQFLHLNEIVTEAFLSAQVPGKFLVESVPIRERSRFKFLMFIPSLPSLVRYIPKWFPGAGFRRYAALVSDTMEQHGAIFFDAVKREIVCCAA